VALGAALVVGGAVGGVVITSINGEPATSNIQLQELTLTKKPGATVDLEYWRNGHTTKTTVTLGAQP
jgi:putative serine protease PepD